MALLSTYAGIHGRVLCALGRFEEAEGLAVQARELGQEDDPLTQAFWRQAAALVLAHRGDHAEAERLAREAFSFTHETDGPGVQGDALRDLAEVLAAAGRRDEAAAALHEALELYDRKENLPLVRRTRERLEAFERVSDTLEGV